MKLIAKGRRVSKGFKFFFLKKRAVYSIQAEFMLLINGERKIKHILSNSRSEYQFRSISIRIDPTIASIISIDE